MSKLSQIDLGVPSLLEFRGPDTVRYLNGQLTQDVRLVAGTHQSLPSCVTDAKGKLQSRVWIREGNDGAILIDAPTGTAEALEARLTRYLIADDVEVADITGQWSLIHLTGPAPDAPEGVVACESQRYGMAGTDWWIPKGQVIDALDAIPQLKGDALEAFRIEQGIPAWGAELTEGLLPPEAGLDATDISYQKGCYIGQEVISRIKSAGKVNRTLKRITIDANIPTDGLQLVDANGKPAGEITSISPSTDNGQRKALAYIKRTADQVYAFAADDTRHAVQLDR